jgi:hypothetical protein
LVLEFSLQVILVVIIPAVAVVFVVKLREASSNRESTEHHKWRQFFVGFSLCCPGVASSLVGRRANLDEGDAVATLVCFGGPYASAVLTVVAVMVFNQLVRHTALA